MTRQPGLSSTNPNTPQELDWEGISSVSDKVTETETQILSELEKFGHMVIIKVDSLEEVIHQQRQMITSIKKSVQMVE